MTPVEFKAWFDGFTEGLSSLPNEKQWNRIKEQIAQINSHPITIKEYITRWPDYPYRWPYTVTYWGNTNTNTNTVWRSSPENSLLCNSSDNIKNVAYQADGSVQWSPTMEAKNFDTIDALYKAGKYDSENI